MPSTRSPLRYPGGKTKLYNTISPIVALNAPKGCYVEPFAGGAGLALELLFRGDVTRIILNDIDYCIYCFWVACLENTEELCKLIDNTAIDVEIWYQQRNIYNNPTANSIVAVGFATFFLNRCNVSGVIRGGPIGGVNQTGKYLLNARFNKKNLMKKIEEIGKHRNQILVYNLDASSFLQTVIKNLDMNSTILNIDPPYVKKGPMLYENSFLEEDHIELSNVIKTINHKWIITYDDNELIRDIYSEYRQESIVLNYSAGQTKKGNEILILSNNVIR